MIILRKTFSKYKSTPIGKRELSRDEEYILIDEGINLYKKGFSLEKVIDCILDKYKDLHKKLNWKRDNSGILVMKLEEELRKINILN